MEFILNKHKEHNEYVPFIVSSIAYKPEPKTKIKILHEYLDNMFIPANDKEGILKTFQKSQRTYYAFSRLVQI